jgi:hypothetical protein
MPSTQGPTEDDLLANGALRIIEYAGWQSLMQSSMGCHVCSFSRKDLQFQSRPHPTRSGAVCEAARKLAASGAYVPARLSA